MLNYNISTFDDIKQISHSHSVYNKVINAGVCVVCSLVLSNAVNYNFSMNNNLETPSIYESNIQDNSKNIYWNIQAVISADLLTKREENMKVIDKIALLEENWNGNGANKFSEELISNAKMLISNFSIQPDVLPTARDSIQMEYEKDSGDYIEFELFKNGQLKVFTFSNHQFNTEYIDLDSANEVFRSFYGQQI